MVRRQQAADRAVRAKMRSPGHPPFHRELESLFWIEIAKGLLPPKQPTLLARRNRSGSVGSTILVECHHSNLNPYRAATCHLTNVRRSHS